MTDENLPAIERFLKDLMNDSKASSIDIPVNDETAGLVRQLTLLRSWVIQSRETIDAMLAGNFDHQPLSPINQFATRLDQLRENMATFPDSLESIGMESQKPAPAIAPSFERTYRLLASRIDALESEINRINTDPLTGIGNRNRFESRAMRLMHAHAPFAIAFLDLDNLKQCNDSEGHAAGDLYICEFVHFMLKNMSSGCTLYRIGGDEFLMIAEKMRLETLSSQVERLRELYIGQHCAEHPSWQFSYGCAESVSAKDVAALVETADMRQYNYKQAHRKRLQPLPDKPLKSAQDDSGNILNSLVFDAFAHTDDSRYLYITNMSNGVSRWSSNISIDFDMPSGLLLNPGERWESLLHPDDRPAFRKNIAEVFSGQCPYHRLTYRVKQRDGRYVMCSCRGVLINTDPPLFAGSIRNHGKASSIDSVTGLPNTIQLLADLEEIRSEKCPIDIIAFRIPQIDRINTIHGFGTGDMLLRNLLGLIQREVPQSSTFYRLEGKRIALILRNCDPAQVEHFEKRIRQIARSELKIENKPYVLFPCSATLHFDAIDEDGIMILAELTESLDFSLRELGSQPVNVSSSEHEQLSTRIRDKGLLREFVINHPEHFYPVFQPQYDLNGKIRGIEALLRCRDDALGMRLSMTEVIELLEDDPCFYDLGHWFFISTLNSIQPLLALFPGVTLSMNVSPRQMEHPDFRRDFKAALEKTGFPPERLVIEMTEHTKPHRNSDLHGTIAFLHECGVSVSADDFGTAYSTLVQLADFPFDEIKISRSFVEDLPNKLRNQLLIEYTMQFARHQKTRTVIEGVETQQELDIVRKLAPDLIQGFYFSKPMLLPALIFELRKNAA